MERKPIDGMSKITDIYSRIYKKLEVLGVMDVPIGDSVHLKSSGFMDLVIERLGENHYSLTHYYEQKDRKNTGNMQA